MSCDVCLTDNRTVRYYDTICGIVKLCYYCAKRWEVHA